MNGLCECGCGEKTSLAPQTHEGKGWVKGKPLRFVRGHANKGRRMHGREDYKVNPETGCWEWLGGTSRGYGWGRFDGANRVVHIYYYERLVGPVPSGLQLDHLCRNRRCCNPDHLEPVTQIENLRRGAGTKLKKEDVEEILVSDETHAALGRHFGVTDSAIRRIREGKNWKDVARPQGAKA